MALAVKDLMQLQCFTHMHLISGGAGLDNKVCGMGILDYELMPEYIDEFLDTFTPGDFVLCSFLYQYCLNKPEEILPMVKALHGYGAAGIGWKNVLYHELPKEVLDFSNEHNFPIFGFGKDIYYETIVYEITDALQTDDRNLLTTENIDSMIHGTMPKNRTYTIAKNISLLLKDYTQICFISQDSEQFRSSISRYSKSLYLDRAFGNKAMIAPYYDSLAGGIFLITTASKNDKKTFDIMRQEIVEALGISGDFYCCSSQIYRSFENLDICFKESYNTYLASLAEGKNIDCYSKLGVYQILVGDYNSSELGEFMGKYISTISDKPDYLEAATAVVKCGGDIAKAADMFGCHQNTIRYKLAKIKELTGMSDKTENDFYMNLALAIRIYHLRQIRV